MSPDLTRVLEELRTLTNKFSLTGSGVGGNLVEGYTIDSTTSGGSAGTGGGGGGTCLQISTVTPVTIGTGYLVGEEMKPFLGTLCPPADNFAFKLRVDAVDGSGGVTAFTIIPMIGYLTPPSNPISFGGTGGTGFTANCTFV